jgi:methionyl-tRNA formyltransferase
MRTRIVFFGTPDFAVASLARFREETDFEVVLVVSQPDRKAGRRREISAPPVARLARQARMPLEQPESIRSDPEFANRLRRLRPEAIVVVAYGKILPTKVLEIPTLGAINLHASLLPRHRGASPIAASLLAGDSVTGVSVMRMTAGLDEGPVYAQQEIPILPDDDAETLSRRLASEGARLLVATLRRVRDEGLAPREQQGDPSWCRPIRKEDGEVDWRRPAAEILRQARAYRPWPGIFTFLGGERIRLIEVAQGPPAGIGTEPGRIVPLPAEGFAVASGDGSSIRPRTLQREGRRPVPADEFLRGIPRGTVRFGR